MARTTPVTEDEMMDCYQYGNVTMQNPLSDSDLDALEALPDSLHMQIAKMLAGLFGPGWDVMYQNKREWIDDRGLRQPDVNGPFKDDCLEAADALLPLLRGEGG